MNSTALEKLTYGLFVLSTKYDGKDNACIINTASLVATNPNLICFSVSKLNYTHKQLMHTDKFTISVLNINSDFEIYKNFGFCSGKDNDKFIDFPCVKRVQNQTLAITKDTNAYISGKIIKREDLGSHTLFIADVTDMDAFNEIPSVTYDYYHQNIKPKPENPDKKGVWRCKICGYEYTGDVLPEDFICPLCKHPASDFERI